MYQITRTVRISYLAGMVMAGWPTVTLAQAPAITTHSGSLIHGSAVTLTVVDADTKPASMPFMHDSGNGVEGAQLEPRGWMVHTNTPRPALSGAVVRATPNRTTSIKVAQTGADVPGFSFGDNGQGGGVEYLDLTAASDANRRVPPATLLIDYWLYVVQSTVSNNYKFMRWHSRFNPTVGSPGGSGGSGGNEFWSFPSGTGSTSSNMLSNYFMLGTSHLGNRWTHITLLLKWGIGSGNSFVRYYAFQGAGGVANKKYGDTDATGRSIAQDSGLSQNLWHHLATGDRLSTFQFEHQDCTLSNCTRNGALYFSDMFIDSGYNRVVLSNHATCTSANLQETQPYTSWPNDDGNLTITLNQGTFPANSSAWLHLYDSNDVCSAGYPIALGTGSAAPAKPTNLRVVPPSFAALLVAGFVGVALLSRNNG